MNVCIALAHVELIVLCTGRVGVVAFRGHPSLDGGEFLGGVVRVGNGETRALYHCGDIGWRVDASSGEVDVRAYHRGVSLVDFHGGIFNPFYGFQALCQCRFHFIQQ